MSDYLAEFRKKLGLPSWDEVQAGLRQRVVNAIAGGMVPQRAQQLEQQEGAALGAPATAETPSEASVVSAPLVPVQDELPELQEMRGLRAGVRRVTY